MNRGVAALIISLIAVSASISFLDTNETERPRIILISIDTFRDDRLSVEGHDRNITPNLDRFVNNAYYFENAYANSYWTKPSHYSLFTGNYPSKNHMAITNSSICPNSITLAETAKKNNYTTASFNGDHAIDSDFGFDQGFGLYNDSYFDLENGTFSAGIKWLKEQEGRSFLFLHGYDVHAPYVLRKDRPMLFGKKYNGSIPNTWYPMLKRAENNGYESPTDYYFKQVNQSDDADRQHLKDMYDNDVYYMDRAFGQFIEDLKDNGHYSDSLIIVVSDHGESFGEHGALGHSTLYEENLRIPLIIKLPHQNNSHSIEEQVSLRDLNHALEGHISGRYPVSGVIDKLKTPDETNVMSEGSKRKSIIHNGYKLIIRDSDLSRPQIELYNLRTDPNETQNIYKQNPETVSKLRKLIKSQEPKNTRHCPAW